MDIVDNPRSYPNLRFGYEKFCEHDLQRRIINGKSPDQKLLVLGFHRWGVFCIDQAEINALFNDDEMVQKYGREMSIFYPYEPNINELVLAKVGNVWCRAIYVARTDATKIIVFCVDYGVECSVSTENIRAFSRQIGHVVRTLNCQIITAPGSQTIFRGGEEIRPISISYDERERCHIVHIL